MDLLKDPNGTRIVKTLPLPPQKPFDSSLLLKEHSATALKNFLKREGKVSLPDYIRLVKAAGHIFSMTIFT